jgi:hypothetical protein
MLFYLLCCQILTDYIWYRAYRYFFRKAFNFNSALTSQLKIFHFLLGLFQGSIRNFHIWENHFGSTTLARRRYVNARLATKLNKTEKLLLESPVSLSMNKEITKSSALTPQTEYGSMVVSSIT